MMSMSARIDKAVGEVKAILSEIFNEGDVSALELLNHALSPIYGDIALMRAAWLEDPDAMELDIEPPLEMEQSGPAKPKKDITEEA